MDGPTTVKTEPNQVAVLEAPQTNSIMNIIAEAAKDPAYDVSKLEKLIALKNDMDNRYAKLAFMRDYAPMKAELPKIAKNKINSHTNSRYADLSQVNEIVDPILGKYGFATSQKVVGQTVDTITILAELMHREGHTDSMNITFPIDNKGSGGNVNKTVIQGMASTISYLKRVAKCTILDIAAGDDRDGNAAPKEAETITTEQAVDIDLRTRALGPSYHKRFLEWLGAETAAEIQQRDYKKALTGLEKAEKEAKSSTTTNNKGK